MSAASRKPLFRADHVGSLLRPPELLEARASWKSGAMSAAALREVEDAAIADAVRLQEDLGLESVTDGEFRRENWWIDFISAIEGIEISSPDEAAGFRKAPGTASGYVPKNVRVAGRLGRKGDIQAADFAFLNGQTSKTAKVTIPSPTRVHFHGGDASVDDAAYPDKDAFWDDLARIWRDEIAALEALGCRYIQIDDPVINYFVDTRMRDNLRAIGEDPDTLIHRYARLLNDCISGRGPETYLTIHLCRGNAQSAWIAEGGYEPLAEALFPVVGVDAWFLEYDDARSGGFEPLRFMPDDGCVVLGLVTTKRGDMEDRDGLRRRIDEAARYVPLDRLGLSPQCGFASVDLGNLIALQDQAAKLSLVIDLAREVWGEA
ncbi:MAG: 5-methyltetrahydropteroyltriglutamate--homocysteine S-methyltransferase [Defluviicoccus sp.]|nr:5-methyltetrahydropteroyltriglutamate--homocysteine S-methyltransferase [Defluviicoccus sp.]